MNTTKKLILTLALSFILGFVNAQLFDDEDIHLNFGIGGNYGRYTNINNLKAVEYYMNLKHRSEGRNLLEEIDLTKFHQGIAFNTGVESKKVSFYAEWHNGIFSDETTYEETSTSGKHTLYEAFKFKMNSFSLSGAYGFKHIKAGASVDYTRFKFFFKEEAGSTNWLKQDQIFNIGFTAFLEINPIKYLKLKPYIQFNLWRDSYTMAFEYFPQYEFSMNHFSNFGVTAFIQIPKSL